MKNIATGVVCLWAAVAGVSAAPVSKHGHSEMATLGDVMRNSIQDAVRSAVAKVVARQAEAHQHAASHAGDDHHSLAQQSSLRGHRTFEKEKATNPWRPAKPLRTLDNALSPVAPANQLREGVEAQGGVLFPPAYYPRVTYYSPHEDVLNPFPQSYKGTVPEAPENFLVCHTSPENWVDKKGFGCSYYATALWCTSEGKPGLKWQKAWGPLMKFGANNISAAEACCECGGGARTTVVGQAKETDLGDRRLYAPGDRVPDPQARWFEKNTGHLEVPSRPLRPVQAPEDYVPIPIKSVAPADDVSPHYARYFWELHNMKQKPQPRGLSVQYYGVPPKDCSAAKPKGSAIDISLDYEGLGGGSASLLGINASSAYSPVGLDAKSLRWPGKKTPNGGLFWAKWSGTVDIVDPGKYSFDLDIGFSTTSWLKIDGEKILTPGQCRASQDEKSCSSKGCSWNKVTGACIVPKQKKKDDAGADSGKSCKKGTYRPWAVQFGCEAQSATVDVLAAPAGETTVVVVPPGVLNFQIAVESSSVDMDLQLKDNSTGTYIVKYNNGIVNSVQREGTYHGMAVSFSGDSHTHESAVLGGVTTSPTVVSLVSHSPSAARVKLTYAHSGFKKCPGKDAAGCKKFKAGDAQKKTTEWAQKLQQRYGQCAAAWGAVLEHYPGGQISWVQWERVWALAWGKMTTPGNDWKIAFAVVDQSGDGFVQEGEFMQTCGAAGPGPAPSPAGSPAPGPQVHNVDTCLTVRINSRPWPKDAFKDTGYKDDPALDGLVGSPQPVKKMTKKGVLVASPDGKQEWFYPKSVFYCYEVIAGPAPPAAAPSPMVSTRGPAPSIANIVPIIVGGPPQGFLQEAAPAPSAAAGPSPAQAPEAGDASVYLGAGGHCIEAMVMVTPSAQSLKLLYSGPDSQGEEVVIPGQVLHCDPVIAACTEPLRQSCINYRPQCGGSPGPSPGGPAPAPA